MLRRWLDGDDLTADDLDEMTAEEEVLDWMHRTPIPERRRPDWLPESAWEQERRAPEAPAARRGVGRGRVWVVAVVVVVVTGASGLLLLGAMLALGT
jgi:hypothetical protein